MAGGGLRDQLGGGFHRYTVDAAWTVPHFEKMLYDNAQLAMLYLEAGAAMARPDFTEVARDTLAFLCREMRDQDGGILASFDADSGGDEGSYYVWSPQELLEVAGPVDGARLAVVLGVTPKGNFEHTGSSVLSRRAAFADGPDGESEADRALVERHRPALLAVRAARTPPGLDRKVVTAWNGLAIAALARGGVACAEPDFTAAAEAAADHLLTGHRRPDGTLWRAGSDRRTAGDGILDDYACLADGLLELFLATGRTKWLAAARELADKARALFAHPDGGYYLTPVGGEAPLGRTLELFDSVVPSGNAVLLQVLLKLGALTGEPAYGEEAEAVLKARAGLLERGGLEVAGWLEALALAVRPPYVVVVAGDGADPATRALVDEARRGQRADVLAVPPTDDVHAHPAALAPALADKPMQGDRPTAYVCRGRTCGAPAHDIQTLRGQLD